MKLTRIVVLLVMLVPSLAHAENYWSSPGAGCVPTSPTILNDLYVSANGALTYTNNATGFITAWCPISRNAGAPNPGRLFITYTDSTGTGSGAFAVANFGRVSRANGAVTTISSISSDSFSPTTATQQFANFSHTLDFDTYYYFVLIVMHRESTSHSVTVFGVGLDEFIEP